MTFAQKLIRLRKTGGMSQEELADRLGVSRQAVSRWEQGSTFPDVPNLQKLCGVFSVSADYLICDGPETAEKADLPADGGEETKSVFKIRENRFLVIGCIWIFAAVCFLLAACSSGSLVHLGLAAVDIILACINFFLHFREKRQSVS